MTVNRLSVLTGVVNDPLKQPHSPAISKHEFRFKICLLCSFLKDGQTDVKIMSTTGCDWGLAKWIRNGYLLGSCSARVDLAKPPWPRCYPYFWQMYNTEPWLSKTSWDYWSKYRRGPLAKILVWMKISKETRRF